MSLSFLTTIHKDVNLQGVVRPLGLSEKARYSPVTATLLNNFGLYRKISSANIFASSSVDGISIFFGYPANSFIHPTLTDFTGNFLQVTNPKNSNNPVTISRFSEYNLNDQTQSVLLVGANKEGLEFKMSFRDLFLEKWNTFLDSELEGTQAVRNGDPVLTWEMWPKNISYLSPDLRYLKIYQKLNIELDWWPDYDASITYHIYLYLDNAMHLKGKVKRWSYWVEGGLKTSGIADELEPQVISGMDKINTELNNELSGLANIEFKDLYYLPGNQTSNVEAIMTGWTTDDITIVLVI
jgi:hypothetical protein